METRAGAAITVRERVLLELARRDKSDTNDTFRAITEAAAVVLDVARVSVWELCEEGESGDELDAKIVCKDLYVLDERKHISFMPIRARDFPTYLRAFRERRTITADDAQSDPRTREFTDFYLKPYGIRSMMDVPIWHHGAVYGVLCFEHVGPLRRWSSRDEDFAIHMTDIASASLEAAEQVALRRRWSTVLDALAESVVVVDLTGKVLHSNPAARRLFLDGAGVDAWDLLPASIELVDAADRAVPEPDQPVARVLRGERVAGEIYGVLFKRSKERRYLRLTCSPIIESGLVSSVALAAVDVTEEVFFERLKCELLSGLAHELKTPLAIAKGYAQQLESSETLRAPDARMLAAIVKACDRMDHLSETLLDLASTILGRLQLTRERVDLAELARAVIRQVAHLRPDRPVELVAPEPVPVVVDPTRIGQALRQIIDNAIAYSPDGGEVEVIVSSSARMATVSVRDQGVGIPGAAQSSIFELFYKAHAGTVHDTGGLGVGLYLAREIVRRHGGDVWFASVEGHGSVFHVALPLAEST